MRVQVSRSKNSESFFIIKSFRDKKTGRNTSRVVERLGTRAALEKELGPGVDVRAWADERAGRLTLEEKARTKRIMVGLSPTRRIEQGVQKSFSGGYLFLQSIYHALGLDGICTGIAARHSFKYDLDSILSRLVYGRVLHPASKISTCRFAETLLEAPLFDDHQVYRALEVLAKESDFIQSELYRNSKKVASRRDRILYYDCTNFFFETEEEDGFRQYAHSKENRPNPVVQMGLFMDADGIPLACTIDAGATSEQTTLIPLEEKILKDFGLAKFVVCTDAGLSSATNRIFNSRHERQFITTQSIKKLRGHLKEWALDAGGWQMSGSDKVYDLGELEHVISAEGTPQKVRDTLSDKTFYKQRMIKEEVSNAGKKETFEQLLIVTFSFKYRSYLRSIRAGHIDRALRAIERNPAGLKRRSQHDFRRLIKTTSATRHGEVAEVTVYAIDEAAIAKEARYDGFYGLCTSLDADDIEGILKVNKNRWEIEECFRIIKSEFLARPSFLSRKDRLTAHFLTCFIALLVYRLLERRLGGEHTCSQIIDCLRSMDFKEVRGEGFEPLYVRTPLTDALHEAFGFYTDYEIVTDQAMKEILKKTRKPETLRHS
jgi:hypothetical protein